MGGQGREELVVSITYLQVKFLDSYWLLSELTVVTEAMDKGEDGFRRGRRLPS